MAVAFVTCLFAAAPPASANAAGERDRRWSFILLSAVSAAVLLIYARTVTTPFLYDDYTHISDAARSTLNSILRAYGPVASGQQGLFYRPTGFLIYWFHFLWAGTNATRWHALSIALHAGNCWLLWLLCRRLRLPANMAVALFACAAGSVESVVWIDARFDLLAGLFSLATLLCVCRYAESAHPLWIFAAAVAAVLGVTSKEAVFAIPILAASLAFFHPEPNWRRRVLTAALWIGLAATAVFAFRWWALGGTIGGYPAGPIDPLRLLNAGALRLWALLFFPVNWAAPMGTLLQVALTVTPFVWLTCLWRCKSRRGPVMGAILFTAASAIPVLHLLMIAPDLSGARILYLPTIGWALLWGVTLESMPGPTHRLLAFTWMALLGLLLLRHNLRPWESIPWQAQRVCTDFAIQNQGRTDRLGVHGLPQKMDGVVMLANGFPECVRWNSVPGAAPLRITVGDEPAELEFDWNSQTNRIEARPRW